MAAPLSIPNGCRDECGSGLGLMKENPRLRTYVRLRAGIFLKPRAPFFLLFFDFSVKPIV